MKKVFLVLFAVVIAISLSACKSNSNNLGTMKIIVAESEIKTYTVSLSSLTIDNGAISVLSYLSENGELTYETDSTGMLLKINSLSPNASSHEFLTIFTSVESDFSVIDWDTPILYEGVTLKSSAKGLTEMTICDGAIIYIKIATW